MEYTKKKKKKVYKEILAVCLLLIGMVFVFARFMYQNEKSILEQNKNYAADSGRQISKRIKCLYYEY